MDAGWWEVFVRPCIEPPNGVNSGRPRAGLAWRAPVQTNLLIWKGDAPTRNVLDALVYKILDNVHVL